MAQEVGTAYVTVQPSARGFGKQVEGEIGAGVAGAEKKSSGLFKGMFGKVAKWGTAAVAAVVTGLTIKGGISRALNIEDAQAKLKGLGHDARSVDQIMVDALASVKGTAYGLDAAATTAASAVASGIKPGKELERYLRLTADAATIAGVSMEEMGSIINKTTAKGKVSMEDLNRLTERGVPILQMLADEYGVTAEEMSTMVSKGEVDAERFRKALETGVGGAALASGDTTRGAFANMGAALSRLGLTVVKPFVDNAKSLFNELTTVIDGLNDRLQPLADAFNESLGGKMANALAGSGDRFLAFFDRIMEPVGRILNLLAPLKDAFKALAPVLDGFGGSFGGLSAGVTDFVTGVTTTLTQVIRNLIPGIISVLLAAIPNILTTGLLIIYGLIDGIVAALPTLQTTLIAAVQQAFRALETLIPTLLGIGLRIFMSLTQAVTQILPELVSTLSTVFGIVLNNLLELLPQFVAAGVTLLTGLADAVTTIVPLLAGTVTEIVPQLITALLTALPDLVNAGLTLFTALVDTIITVAPMLLDAIVGLLPVLVDGLLSMIPTIISVGMQVVGGLITAITTVLPQLVDAIVAALPLIIRGAIQLFHGLIDGLMEVLPDLLVAVLDVLPVVVDALLQLVPGLIMGAIELFMALIEGLLQVLPQLLGTIVGLLPVITMTLLEMLPSLLQAAVSLFLALVQALPVILPQLVAAIAGILPTLVQSIVSMLPAILNAAVQLFMALIQSIPIILPQLIAALIGMIPSLVGAIVGSIPQILQAGIELFLAIVSAIPKMLPQLIAAIPQLVNAIKDGFTNVDWFGLGMQVINGIISGLMSMAGAVWDAIVSIANDALGGALSFFGIASPSRLMRDRVGKWIPLGIAAGIEETGGSAVDSAKAVSADIANAFAGPIPTVGGRSLGASYVAVGQPSQPSAGDIIYNDNRNVYNPVAEPDSIQTSRVMQLTAAGGGLG